MSSVVLFLQFFELLLINDPGLDDNEALLCILDAIRDQIVKHDVEPLFINFDHIVYQRLVHSNVVGNPSELHVLSEDVNQVFHRLTEDHFLAAFLELADFDFAHLNQVVRRIH